MKRIALVLCLIIATFVMTGCNNGAKTEILRAGTYETTAVTGTEINLDNTNGTSLRVIFTTGEGCEKWFSFESFSVDGVNYTRVTSPVWTDLNNIFIFQTVNIKFRQSGGSGVFTIYSPTVMLEDFSDSAGFKSVRIDVTKSTDNNTIKWRDK